MARRKKISGDVIKMNIVAPAPSAPWPWIRMFRYPYGLLAKKSSIITERLGTSEKSQKSRHKLALEIGEAVIDGSKVLSKWFK
ncbi:MAG: hypothetical protein KKD29_06730 [Candidatus Omnitrophica bacterium]|nr:hypothetical protein [Candidatus Omnitrophota bacterium]